MMPLPTVRRWINSTKKSKLTAPGFAVVQTIPNRRYAVAPRLVVPISLFLHGRLLAAIREYQHTRPERPVGPYRSSMALSFQSNNETIFIIWCDLPTFHPSRLFPLTLTSFPALTDNRHRSLPFALQPQMNDNYPTPWHLNITKAT